MGRVPTARALMMCSVRLTMLDGPSKDSGATKNITIVAPSGGSASKQPTSGIRHFQNWWSCGFIADIYVSPADVSFANLFFKEEEVGASANGWLAFLNTVGHSPGGAARIGFGSISTGARVAADDHIFSGKYNAAGQGAYAAGIASWSIPWKYSVGGVVWSSITTANQSASSTSTGKCSISKQGSGLYSKELSDSDSEW